MSPDNEEEYYRLAKELWHHQWCRTPMEHLNLHFRAGGEHLFAYDEDTLIKTIKDAGFVDIRLCPYDPEIDSEDRQPGTIYVAATKSASNS